jgi:hypothetical protein
MEVKGATTMKKIALSSGGSALVLFVCLSLTTLCSQRAIAQDDTNIGATYMTTNTDSTGAFMSRSALTFTTDHTLSVIDSGQGGPTYFYSSEQGTWGTNNRGTLVGRTVDFDFSPAADVAATDYTFKFGANGTISGTIKFYTFPLMTGNPNDGVAR